MIDISPKQPDCRGDKRLATLLSAQAVDVEALARLRRCPFRASGRLSARFDFGLVPSQPDEKSRRQSPPRSRRQFPAPPPRRPGCFLFINYCPQCPQQPEDRGHQFDPGLFAPFRRQAIELAADQTEFLLPESDEMLDTEELVVYRFELTRIRSVGWASF